MKPKKEAKMPRGDGTGPQGKGRGTGSDLKNWVSIPDRRMQIIEIELKKHCIETEAKRTYERLLNRYFDKSLSDHDRAILQEQIEGIKFFLEHADFRRLRSQYPELDGKHTIRLTLKIPKNRYDMIITYNGVKIAPFREALTSL